MRDKGGRGSEKPQNLRDVIYGWSLSAFSDRRRKPIGRKVTAEKIVCVMYVHMQPVM